MPELFRYVASMSAAVNGKADQIYAKLLGNASEVNRRFRMFWVGVGKDDTLTGPGDRGFEQVLTKRGIMHTFKVTDGRHEWTVWRHHLNEVAPLLFR